MTLTDDSRVLNPASLSDPRPSSPGPSHDASDLSKLTLPGPSNPARVLDLNANYIPTPPAGQSAPPLPTSQAPTDEPGPSSPHGNTDLNPSLDHWHGQGLTDNSDR